jgi:hypothetical protein
LEEGKSSARPHQQILADVASGVFMMPGESQGRTRRVIRAVLSIQNVDCGGLPLADLDRTAERQDQARYPQLSLISAKGFSEDSAPEDEGRVTLDPSCAARSLPRVFEWEDLVFTWAEATESVLGSPAMQAVLEKSASCLAEESGFEVDSADPAVDYLQKVDAEAMRADGGQEADAMLAQRSSAYVKCLADYEREMEAALKPLQEEAVRTHEGLLNAMASDLAAAGYEP